MQRERERESREYLGKEGLRIKDVLNRKSMLMSNAIEKVQTYICWLDALVVVRCHNLIKVDQQNLFITIVMECVITTEEYQQQSLIKSPRFFYITSYGISNNPKKKKQLYKTSFN